MSQILCKMAQIKTGVLLDSIQNSVKTFVKKVFALYKSSLGLKEHKQLLVN